MRLLILSLALALAACGPDPQPTPPPPTAPTVVPAAAGTNLTGLTAGDLVQRFGSPALQIREGASVKLQFRGAGCVLDTYLYPSAPGGPDKVSYVEARLPSGADTNQQACIAALDALR